jgi:Protein of unknown function (DUF2924)
MSNRVVGAEIAALPQLAVQDLRTRYAEVFGEGTRSGNRAWLIKRLAWRLQALAEGDLSERAKQRAAELADDADLRTTAPRERETPRPVNRSNARSPKADHRLPPPGTVITRQYKGAHLEVLVQRDGFTYAGARYPTLSAVAKTITGSHCNGFLFFRLTGKGGAR